MDNRCQALTGAGTQCRSQAATWNGDSVFCHFHRNWSRTVRQVNFDTALAQERDERIEQAALLRDEKRNTRRGIVYRHFTATDELLYVGMSRSRVERALTHLSKEWGLEVAYITVEHHPDLVSAERAEAIAIRDENPRYNITRPLNRSQDGHTVVEGDAPAQACGEGAAA